MALSVLRLSPYSLLPRRTKHICLRFASRSRSDGGINASPPSPKEIGKALFDLQAIAGLSRKPWLLLERHRRSLEQHFEVETGILLLGLQRWAEVAAGGLPTVAGIANVSGNVYFACDLTVRSHASKLPVVKISAVQALIANLFSHSEIGLDAVVSRNERPAEVDLALIKELYTFPELRWLHSDLTQEQLHSFAETGTAEADRGQPKEVVLTTSGRWEIKKRKSLGKYPRVRQLFDISPELSPAGDCMRHDGYLHQEVEGTCMDEWQVSFAQGAARKAYSVASAPLAGCAVLNSEGKLFAGSTIATRERGDESSLSPLECAMVSMAANGAWLNDIAKVVWTSESSQASAELYAADAERLEAVAPAAVVEHVAL